MKVKYAEVGGVLLSRIWSISYYADEIKVACIHSFKTQELVSTIKWDQIFKA